MTMSRCLPADGGSEMDTRPFLGLAPNWYPDAADRELIRYWDGTQVVAEMHWDGSQWVDWWQASDGEFYPPELHPSATQADPASAPETIGHIVAASTEADSTPSTPLRRRRHGKVFALSAVGVAALLVVSLVVGLGGQKNAEATVLGAVNSTLADRTAHVSLTMTADAGGVSNLNATGTGGIDFSQNAMQMDFSMEVSGQSLDLQADYLGGTIYESIPQIGQIEPGKSWVSMDLSSLKSASGNSASSSLSVQGNPAEMLRMLAEHGNTVVSIGGSTVDGTAVQGYGVTVSAAKIRSELASSILPDWMRTEMANIGISGINYMVYIDGQGLLRRITISMHMAAGGTPVSLTESLDLSDYGTSVSVSAPPADQVVSFQQFIQDAQQATG
jgi:hypothetical protein